ncbi:hypothetical protein ACFL6C_01140 [Myxococcota bacterium]
MLLAGGGWALIALVPLGFVARGIGAWFGRSTVWWVITLAGVALAGWALREVDDHLARRQAEFETLRTIDVPEGMELPVGWFMDGVDPAKTQVMVRGETIEVAGREVARADLVSHLQEATGGELGKCGSDRGPTVLVAGADRSFGGILELAEALGPCVEIAILPEVLANLPPESPEMETYREQIGNAGIVDELVFMTFFEYVAARAHVAKTVAPGAVIVAVGPASIRVRLGDAERDLAHLADRVDREALATVLRGYRNDHPDRRALAITAAPEVRLQDVVDVMHVSAQPDMGPGPFDPPQWLTESLPPLATDEPAPKRVGRKKRR